MKLDCWDGMIGQRLKAESTSKVATSVPGGALITRSLMSLKVPQSQVKRVGSIPSLIDEIKGSFLGKERSWMTLRSEVEPTLGTVPNGEVRKGPIRNSKREREKGPE